MKTDLDGMENLLRSVIVLDVVSVAPFYLFPGWHMMQGACSIRIYLLLEPSKLTDCR